MSLDRGIQKDHEQITVMDRIPLKLVESAHNNHKTALQSNIAVLLYDYKQCFFPSPTKLPNDL